MVKVGPRPARLSRPWHRGGTGREHLRNDLFSETFFANFREPSKRSFENGVGPQFGQIAVVRGAYRRWLRRAWRGRRFAELLFSIPIGIVAVRGVVGGMRPLLCCDGAFWRCGSGAHAFDPRYDVPNSTRSVLSSVTRARNFSPRDWRFWDPRVPLGSSDPRPVGPELQGDRPPVEMPCRYRPGTYPQVESPRRLRLPRRCRSLEQAP